MIFNLFGRYNYINRKLYNSLADKFIEKYIEKHQDEIIDFAIKHIDEVEKKNKGAKK